VEATKKPKKRRIKRGEAMPKKNKSKDIDYKILKNFVGEVENLLKIDAKHLYDNRYRINVWTEIYKEGMFCPFHKIEKSYFIHYVDGEIVDKTIPSKPKEERIFQC
jgi:hypothetical protein|tara:strand:- start:126 stop:443 length:318 start_codon:yes stop_codon:yes gene_type:complete